MWTYGDSIFFFYLFFFFLNLKTLPAKIFVFVNCHFLREKPYGKVKHFFFKWKTWWKLLQLWSSILLGKQWNQQRGKVNIKGQIWATGKMMGPHQSFLWLPEVSTCPQTRELFLHWVLCGSVLWWLTQLLFSEVTKHKHNIFAHEEHIWENTIIFFCLACSNSCLLLTWRGRVWCFSGWNANWDQINAIDFILCSEELLQFFLLFIYFFSSGSILWEVEERNKGVKCCQRSSGTEARARAAQFSTSLNRISSLGQLLLS